MSTLVCFHAHPDDECIQTGGTMAQAAADGHRVVLVVATRGERGEIAPGVLADGEALWQRRIAETYESARILGAARVEFLGYVDSGMIGDASNDEPYTFWSADVEHAANRLAAILREESADVLTAYDHHGGYGHPDHIQVHRVGLRAAEIAGTPVVLQATMNRDQIMAGMAEERAAAQAASEVAREVANEEPIPTSEPEFEPPDDFGEPEANMTHAVDVAQRLEAKRAAMAAHGSQIPSDSWFLTMDDSRFARAFGTEWFIRVGQQRAAGAPMRTSIWE